MDFVSDQLYDGTWFRTLTLVDVFTRECLCTHVSQSIRCTDVVKALEQICVTEVCQGISVSTTGLNSFQKNWIYERIQRA